MERITVKNLTLQFNANNLTEGDPQKQVTQAVELINDVLQREPYGLDAQILTISANNNDVTVEKFDDELEEDDYLTR